MVSINRNSARRVNWKNRLSHRRSDDEAMMKISPPSSTVTLPVAGLNGHSIYDLPTRSQSPLSSSQSVDGIYSGKRKHHNGKVEIQESENYEILAFSYPQWRKWTILVVVFLVQVSMNFNTSIYANAIAPMSKHFSLSESTIRLGQMIFLIAYAFGSELWAPWSEELGRWPVMQLSLFLVNIWQILCALAPKFHYILVGRFLGGLSSAGGSVTLGMIADMWEPDDQQFAVAFIVLSSVAGSVVGPIAGGFMEVHLDWRWNFWIQLILGAAVQLAHFFLVPETRSIVLLDRLAKKKRKSGEENVYGPLEIHGPSLSAKEVCRIWIRPFSMFVREPIVLFLSLLSGFSDALIFTFLESYQPVFRQWGFGTIQIGLAFIPIILGYFVGYFSFFPFIIRDKKAKTNSPDAVQPESRLWWLLFTAPLETIGLFGFAWTSSGPPIHWISPMIFSSLIAIANYCIYMATIDYMVASYGPYSASATGGNALARDLLAGIAALYSTPMYRNIKHKYKLQIPSTILGCISILVTAPIYIFYWKGPAIREKSKFAQGIARDRRELSHRRAQHVKSSLETAKQTIEV